MSSASRINWLAIARRCGLTAFVALVPSVGETQPVVAGPAVDRALTWRLEPRWSVGGGDDEQLLLSLLYPKDVAPGARGELFLIDRTENQIVEYNSTGARTRTLGRKGMGPGELSAPLWLDVASDGSLHVGDAEKRTVVVFAPDASVRPEYRPNPRLRSPRWLSDGTRVGTVYRGRDTLDLLAASENASVRLLSYVAPASRSTPPVCGLTDYPAGPVFAPELLWAVRGTQIVAAVGAYRLTVFEGGKATRVLTRSVTPRRSSLALARKHLGAGETFQIFGMPPCTVPTDLILSVAEIATELPAYSSLAVSPDGRIWATRFRVKGEAGLADVYHAEHGYEGTVALGSARPVAFLATGDLVSIELDADDTPQVVVYRIQRR